MDTHCTMIQLLVVWQRLDVTQITNSAIMRIEPVELMAIGAVLALPALKWVSKFNNRAFESLSHLTKYTATLM